MLKLTNWGMYKKNLWIFFSVSVFSKISHPGNRKKKKICLATGTNAFLIWKKKKKDTLLPHSEDFIFV
jgi:hypothetical protein